MDIHISKSGMEWLILIIDMGYWNKVIRRIIELGFAVLLFCIALKLSIFYIPFIIALAIAMTIEPIIKWVSKKTNLERKKSAMYNTTKKLVNLIGIYIAILFLKRPLLISTVIFGYITKIFKSSRKKWFWGSL